MFNKLLKYVVPGAGLSALAGNAMAVTDYSSITAAVDFADVATGIVGVLAAVALVMVAFKGGKMLIRAI